MVVVDTGYLFPETYRLIDELADILTLDLLVFHPVLSSVSSASPGCTKWTPVKRVKSGGLYDVVIAATTNRKPRTAE